ncbi:glycosyltransferase [Streptomyces sp. SID4950]|nr:glycosyltransferase family 2 protein [Streptomyces sp. SID4950]MYQ67075.1 glycosyltransferase [Streptomyces sp. SID4950]
MPYLTRCVTSAAEQTIGRDVLEVIVVDDGSTDGTAAELERLNALYPDLLRIFRQENSGGPSAPRNLGLDHARGRFVFFLDADDHLGAEALERMVATAERHATDVVLGRTVGVGGRGAPASMFDRNQPRTDVFSSRVWWTLNPMKLFRRALLERHALRFPTDLPIGEDQVFTGAAYLHADGISVVADYDCLYWVQREDGGNITRRLRGSEPRVRFLPRVVRLLLDHVPAGPGRDHLAHRHLTVDVRNIVAGHLVHEPRATQRAMLARLADAVEPLLHEGMRERLSAMARLRLHLVSHRMLDELIALVAFERDLERGGAATPLLVENGRAYARYPFLRDPGRAVPDHCYDVTDRLGVRHHLTRAELDGATLHLAGHAYLHRVPTLDVGTELVLRERESGVEHRLPVTPAATPGLGADEDGGRFAYDLAGFTARVDVTTAAGGAPLTDGLWDVSLAVGAQGLSRETRIGRTRAGDVSGATRTHVVPDGNTLRAVTLYTTRPHGNLTLDLGERKHAVLSHLTVDGVRWAGGAPAAELEINGLCTLAGYPEGALRVVLDDGTGTAASFTARRDGDVGFVARIPVTRLTSGDWGGELRLGPWASPLPPLPAALPPAKWRRNGLPRYAKPAPGGAARGGSRCGWPARRCCAPCCAGARSPGAADPARPGPDTRRHRVWTSQLARAVAAILRPSSVKWPAPG